MRLLSDGRRGTGARILEASDGIELEGVGSLSGIRTLSDEMDCGRLPSPDSGGVVLGDIAACNDENETTASPKLLGVNLDADALRGGGTPSWPLSLSID